ncbi:UDP-N-acetylmuramoyl-tripeptide--D-alanyl-D-alanine ligase [Candidatus Pantoea edessiphila]|uniref:UDP-N-acetylmuramoyl-tripeptide--D-alanyl-D-alanine ligase n=1 Tax=Candidatus Pantoea edessiphila TaxID=2044610 RepID=A0A2P5SY67_9GAMM|nr:UDP-N-acetylmuramoyl-tripeptide--D-alanyl-D-alanine ligase [Candidatus Pantoea edessiphila]MBK4775593.1 UDP-N-acetylmuramoyl-tripeptide--D-alanyl-D-alanine ligase [Pantoea sp. Edef]PPI87243.1 UDP-N-acetylmuramoyl-tripeptide--D-alanyl-D-alanine ligase [Candidatus Pantoea edessiphila]
MISVSLSKLAEITDGKLYGNNCLFDCISTNTKQIISGSLFIAIIGKRFDAHNFAYDAISQGAKALLVNKYLPISIPQVVVRDTTSSFGIFSAWVRKQVPTRIVALTGSTGKTSVREMTAAILHQCGHTLCNQGNLNNKFGVPMTLVRLTNEHKYAVIELGAARQGDISYTTKLVYPENVLVNNISASHLEGFGSLSNIAKEKGEIFNNFSNKGIAIINDDSNDWLNWQKYLINKTVWRFSLKNRFSDFFAYNIITNETSTSFSVKTPFGSLELNIPLIGIHNISNALAATSLSLSLGIQLEAVSNGLRTFNAIPGRLFPIYLSRYQILLDDSYNANVGSMKAAMKLLSSMTGYRVMVVGDLAELGDKSNQIHRSLGIYSRNMSIDLIISIGKHSHLISENSIIGEHYINKKTLIKRLKLLLFKHQKIIILIKGSRSANMEQIVQELL